MSFSVKHTVLLASLLCQVNAWGDSFWGNGWGRERPSSCGYAGGPATVTIDAGVVRGSATSLPLATASVNKFLGIPFADNPPQRFSPAKKPKKFSGPLNATAFGPSCPQQFALPGSAAFFNNPPPVESESCLYLNVFAPSTPAPADGRPVMFWIYGGALQFGNAGQPAYDGSSFAAYEDVVLVTINYRMNVFGFPHTDELPKTSQNLGFLDQRLALDWVQRNIKAFGGSPDKVTIFGESAGAFSVDALLTSYDRGCKVPFRGAILQSGQYSYRATKAGTILGSADPDASFPALAKNFNCPGTYSNNVECLRAVNSTDIIKFITEKQLDFLPSPDEVTLVANPAKRRREGKIARIPVLGGTNAQEGRIFTIVNQNATSNLQTFFANDTQRIQNITAAYPIGSQNIANAWDQASTIFTDLVFQCPARRWALDTASIGTPTWRYFYNSSFPNTAAFPGLGVYHASEIQLVFNTYSKSVVTTQEYALAEYIRGTWAKFARNPERGPGWNRLTTGVAGTVLVGASSNATGGYLTTATGDVQNGTFNLAVLGNRGSVLGSGATIIDPAEVDFRCGTFDSLYDENTA